MPETDPDLAVAPPAPKAIAAPGVSVMDKVTKEIGKSLDNMINAIIHKLDGITGSPMGALSDMASDAGKAIAGMFEKDSDAADLVITPNTTQVAQEIKPEPPAKAIEQAKEVFAAPHMKEELEFSPKNIALVELGEFKSPKMEDESKIFMQMQALKQQEAPARALA